MSLMKTIFPWLSTSRGDAQIERDIEDELNFHIEMRAGENIARGMSPAESRGDALQRFGNVTRIKRECREIDAADSFHVRIQRIAIRILALCGVVTRIISAVYAIDRLKPAGDLLLAIAFLWRLLVYMRAIQPIVYRTSSHLEIAPRQISPHDEHGRTPVERLLEDETRS